jgi:hypothetical protein
VRRPFDAPVVTDYSTASVSSFTPQVRRYLRGSFLLHWQLSIKQVVLLTGSVRGRVWYLAIQFSVVRGPSTPLINPVFAQFEAVLLCCFLTVKDRTLDALDLYNRTEAARNAVLSFTITASQSGFHTWPVDILIKITHWHSWHIPYGLSVKESRRRSKNREW